MEENAEGEDMANVHEPSSVSESEDQGKPRKIRLTVDINSRLNDILTKLSNETGTSKSEIFRRAVALFDVAHEARNEGKHIGIADDQNKLDREFIGI